MKTIKHYMYALIWLSIAAAGCTEDKIAPLESNANPPGQISNVKIENLPGKAKITYTLPGDQDLLYIKAVYPISSGSMREVRASYYANSMVLDGFSTTDEQSVQLYAVNRSEVASEPVNITVKPLENPIWAVFRSLQIQPDFAGMRITAENPQGGDVVLEIIRKDSLGKWEQFLPYVYSSQETIGQTNRGLDTLEQEFGVTVRDRFLNYTDTLYRTIRPLYEEQLSKSLFGEVRLPGDAQIQTVTDGMPRMWDGNTTSSNRMMTEPADPEEQFITVDMGQFAKLSRIKIWNYAEFFSNGDHQYYYRGQLRHFEVWGSANPDPDGSWDSWTMLGTYENIKPSGLPYGQTSGEDWDKAVAGFDYDFNPDAPKVRYLRFKCLENWMGTTWFEIQEINVYGDTR